MAQVLLLMQQQMAAQQRMLERMAKAPPLTQLSAASVPPETRPSAMRIDFERFRESPRTGMPGRRYKWPKYLRSDAKTC